MTEAILWLQMFAFPGYARVPWSARSSRVSPAASPLTLSMFPRPFRLALEPVEFPLPLLALLPSACAEYTADWDWPADGAALPSR
ncbi:hypothetical protein THAOC_26294 [Thalassiosira oceanica]|uniref:Uncharacterized protein n=1 Tax=Thalassiosira oceanica TaxID=159749 RepID=K0RPD5_THAOC|nr:hypothetical protein THAOC_26294 [Thalassiosira oceanica]|eukprot:EJK54144.1 hypothetical protein THAOC_26294 [Thalassiosira oceanica]